MHMHGISNSSAMFSLNSVYTKYVRVLITQKKSACGTVYDNKGLTEHIDIGPGTIA